MFETITAERAAADQWDVVIAGSSFAAMFFLAGLPRDARVLVVEKGPTVSHADQLATMELPRAEFRFDNRSDRPKHWVAHTMFGGNSNCWWGQVPRFHPSDFTLFEDHGVGAPGRSGTTTLSPSMPRSRRSWKSPGRTTTRCIHGRDRSRFRRISCPEATRPVSRRGPISGCRSPAPAPTAAAAPDAAPTASAICARWIRSSRY